MLKVGRDFTNWIKDRLAMLKSVQGQAFEMTTEFVLANFGGNKSGHRPKSVYTLSLDTAKELAMLMDNDLRLSDPGR